MENTGKYFQMTRVWFEENKESLAVEKVFCEVFLDPQQPSKVCNGLISMKTENMQLDLLPSMLTQKPYDWENEYDFKAKSPSISQEQVVV